MRKKRFMLIIIVLLVVGFASVTTTLVINGTVGIAVKKDDFNVIFIDGTLNGEASNNVVIGEKKQKLTFTMNPITNVGRKEELEYRIKNTSTQYDTDVTINCTHEENDYIKVIGKLDNKEMTETVRIAAQEIKSGTVSAEMIKSYTGEELEIPITCTIQADAVEREGTAEKDYTGEQSKLNFNVNGGSNVESKTLKVGDTYGELPTPTRAGYTFNGWYTEEIDGEKVDGNKVFNNIEGETIYAHWTANTYIVSFNANGGEEISSTKSVTYDETYGELPRPTKAGYTFAGWYEDAEYNEKVESTTKVNIVENTTLYAKWTTNTYTITFDSNGGSAVESKEVTYSGLYGELVTPIREGYTFVGWYNGEEVITSETRVSVTEDTTLTAKWNANKYTITLNADGGDISVGSIEVTYDESYANLPSATKTGYTFAGWYNGEELITNETKVSITEDATLTAKWTANKYTVSFNANTGSVTIASKEVTYNETYGELPTPTKAGYTFNGWYTDATNGTQVTDSTVVTITEDQTLYAHWTANSGINYKVYHWQQNVGGDANSYDESNYTLVSTDAMTGTTDQIVTPNVNTYTGFTSPSTEELTVKADGSAVINYYYIRKEYNVTINKGAGVTTVTGNGKHQYGETVTIGYTIANGYSFKDITGDKTTSSFSMPANDVTVSVNTTEITYSITYTMNNGTNNSSNPTSYKVTSNNITLQEPTRVGYTFTGWTGSNGTTANKNVAIAKGSYGNKSYTANWRANTYTVSFDANKGNAVTSTLTVTYDGTYGNSLPTPTRAGYTFAGWYTDATNGNKVESTTKVTITANQTLYAHWTAKTYTISYNLNSGTAGTYKPTSGTFDSVITISNPTRAGYTFEGWTVTSGLNPSTAKYGTSNTTVTSAISSSSSKVKAQYFKNLTTGSSVTLTANWKKVELYLSPGYYLTNDLNNNGVANVGDEIRVGTESFYVISNNNNQLNALAKYNLNVGTNKNPNVTEGIQHETVRGYLESGTTYGNVKFSNASGWPYENNATIDIKKYNGPVKEALYGTNGYQNYIQKTISSASVRLITIGELEDLGCDLYDGLCESAPNWVYSTQYWIQTADSEYQVRYVNSSSDIGIDSFKTANQYGVRPVITIPLN